MLDCDEPLTPIGMSLQWCGIIRTGKDRLGGK